MFERYTERARRVLFFARYEASQTGGLAIETEHLLLGLLREGKGLTSRIFAEERFSPEDVRLEIERGIIFREKTATSVEIPFTNDTKKVLASAAEEADRLRHHDIGTEHLLLGLLVVDGSMAASILKSKGLTIERVRERIVALLQQGEHLGGHDAAAMQRVYGVQIASASHIKPRAIQRMVSVFAEARETMPPGHWRATAIGVKAISAKALDIAETRIELPQDVSDTDAFDIVVALGPRDGDDAIKRILRDAVAATFGLSASIETRRVIAYVLTAPHGPSPGMTKTSRTAGGISFAASMMEFAAEQMFRDRPASNFGVLHGLSGHNWTMAAFCQELEGSVGRPVVDETGFDGAYDFAVKADGPTVDALLAAVERQLGIHAELLPRDIQIGVVKKI